MGQRQTKLAKREKMTPAPKSTMPFDLSVQREMLMEAAGLTVVERARILKLSVDEQVSALKAVMPAKRKRVEDEEGNITETVEEGGAPDWSARLKAARDVEELVGASGKLAISAGGGGRDTVNIVIAPYAQVPREQQAEVIEVKDKDA